MRFVVGARSRIAPYNGAEREGHAVALFDNEQSGDEVGEALITEVDAHRFDGVVVKVRDVKHVFLGEEGAGVDGLIAER